VERKAQLFQIVLALSAASSLAGLLYGRQQQCDQNRDDGDDDQQFNQRKPAGTLKKPPISNGCRHGISLKKI
jgi:hypothetical protein